MTIPGLVSTVYARPFASPKSVRLADPGSSIITFDGLTSRCTMPPACSASNPDATWATTADHVRERERPVVREASLEGLAADERHRQVRAALGLARRP